MSDNRPLSNDPGESPDTGTVLPEEPDPNDPVAPPFDPVVEPRDPNDPLEPLHPSLPEDPVVEPHDPTDPVEQERLTRPAPGGPNDPGASASDENQADTPGYSGGGDDDPSADPGQTAQLWDEAPDDQ